LKEGSLLKKYLNIAFILSLVILLFTGCGISAVGDLYSPPKRSDEYTNMQTLIQQIMSDAEFSAPIAGENQQSVQAVDLDGDGEDEYLLFARDSSEKPLKIYVFSGEGRNYSLVDVILSAGSAHDRVEYIQMDDNPGFEIVVGRRVSDQVVRSVSVYALNDGQMEQIMSTNYTEFLCCDLDGNGKGELLIFRPGEVQHGIAVRYSVLNGVVERSQEVSMSEQAENIKRIMYGYLQDGTRAVYIASSVTGSDQIITDVFAVKGAQLTNVSFSTEAGTSVQTLRNYYVYADDVDDDTVLELPSLITMPTTGEDTPLTNQHIIRWYAMNSDGSVVDKMYTYHNFVGGWYLELEAEVARRITVEQRGSSYVFLLWNDDMTQTQPLLTIYVLTGQKREEQAIKDNRFILLRGESTIYSAALDVSSADYNMTQESLITGFHLILQDWKTGET
jgi:hypothetical protein